MLLGHTLFNFEGESAPIQNVCDLLLKLATADSLKELHQQMVIFCTRALLPA